MTAELLTAANEAQLSNALVGQKAYLMTVIDAVDDGKDAERAWSQCSVLFPVWYAVEYGYKAAELKARLRAKCRGLIEKEEMYLAACRKNCRTRAMTEASIEKLRAVIAETA